MILTGKEIDKQVMQGRIHIKPYNPESLNPNSYNFRIGNQLKIYKNQYLDSAQSNEAETIEMSLSGFWL